MKHTLILISIILTALIFNVFKQDKNNTIKVTYVKAYKNYKDTTSTSPKVMKNLEYQLLANTNEARFEYIPSMSIDGDNNTNERYIGKGGGKGIFYKNLKEKKNIKVLSEDGDNYIISDKFNKYKWELFKERKVILGYECFKAIGSYQEYNYFLDKNQKITVIVWYTPKIPLSFGPSGFDGLPGLVLESIRGSFYITASNITINNSDKIKQPTGGIEITDEDFAKKQYNAFKKRAKN